jgi:hypothetical protein
MAMVVNEYGKVLGLVTMDDLLAQLFGAIRDEREGQQKAALRRGRGGRTPVPGSLPSVSDGGGPIEQEMTPPPMDPADLTPPPVDVPGELGEAGGPRHTRATTHDDDDDDDDDREASPVPVSDVQTGPSGPVPAGDKP